MICALGMGALGTALVCATLRVAEEEVCATLLTFRPLTPRLSGRSQEDTRDGLIEIQQAYNTTYSTRASYYYIMKKVSI